MESASSGASGSATVIPSLSALKSEQSRLKSERNTFQLKFAEAQRLLNDAQREILEERIDRERLVCELGDVKAELAETRSAAAALEVVEKGKSLSGAEAELAEVRRVLRDREVELAGLRKQFEELKARDKERPAKSLRETGCQADTPPQYSLLLNESEHQINKPFAASTPSTFTNLNRKTRIVQYVGLPPYRRSRVSSTKSDTELQRKPETTTQKKVSSAQTPIHSARPFASTSTSTNLLKRKADDSGSELGAEESQKKPKTEMVIDAKKDVLKGLKFSKNREVTTTTVTLDSSTSPTPGFRTTRKESFSSSSSCSVPSVLPLPALQASTSTPVTPALGATIPPPTPSFHVYVKNLIDSLPSSSGSSPTHSQPPTTPANLKLVVEIRRDLLASSFGVAGQQMVARISKEKNPTGGIPWDRRLLLPSLDRNPYLPSKPRQPGVFFSARSKEDLGMERCSLFVKRDGMNKVNEAKKTEKKGKATPLWEYTGEYKVHWEGMLKAKWYTELDSKIQLTIEKDILKKPKHAHYRERIARRLSTRSNKVIDAKKLSLDDVKWALESGEEEINLFYLEPLGYDEFFADEMMRRIRESEPETVVTGDVDGKKQAKSTSGKKAADKDMRDDPGRVSAASANLEPTLPNTTPKPSLTVSTSVVDPGYGSEDEVEMDLSPLSDSEAGIRLRGSSSSTSVSTLMDSGQEQTRARGSQKVNHHTDLDFDSEGELTELEDDDVNGEGDYVDNPREK